MAGLTSVVVVREVHANSACAIVALCAEHTGLLKAARCDEQGLKHTLRADRVGQFVQSGWIAFTAWIERIRAQQMDRPDLG